MPVLDHEVHESVRTTTAAFRYGCNGMAFHEGYYAPARRTFPDGRFEVTCTYIPHRMSTICRYDQSLLDTGCTDCPMRGQGEEYDQMIRNKV